jgi:hypothetical protein
MIARIGEAIGQHSGRALVLVLIALLYFAVRALSVALD